MRTIANIPVKRLMAATLLALVPLALVPPAMAQAASSTRDSDARATRDADARSAAQRAERDAEDAKVRAQLDKARAELDRKAKEVAELSMKLSGANDAVYINDGPRRAVLGVQIDTDSGRDGARVRLVSPGGAAEAAGMQAGDVIVALDGKALTGSDQSGKLLVERMRDVKPDQKVKIRALRAGKNKDFVVVARPMEIFPGMRGFAFATPDGDVMAVGGDVGGGLRGPGGPMPMIRQFRTFFHNEFDGLELASITPKLGAYFGANDGVLVVSAPKDGALKVEDGDVIQSIDGRKPTDGGHALRILRSYKPGEKLGLTVLRQHKPVTLAVTMPERSDFDEDFMGPGLPGLSTIPAPPPAPAVPAT
ncbi:MAG TPA: PDZ domain-containing protein [Steroidobacteraceae bacterium]|nr:PDZ domain-containing protein [Steroidobacteraceae bacterium]